MGWSIGEEDGRDIGYGVPAICDHPKCNKKIDRGLSYICKGCGLYFCEDHLEHKNKRGEEDDYRESQYCPKCSKGDANPYKPKGDILEWIAWKLYDESWEKWREENKEEVEKLKNIIINI